MGGLGLLDEGDQYVSSSFPEEGLLVMLLGASNWSYRPSGLAGSEYLEMFHDTVAGRPYIRLNLLLNTLLKYYMFITNISFIKTCIN